MDEHLKNYYLAHHGVAGQKWGQRHGPPYPLSRNPANAKRAKVDYKQNGVHVNKSNLGKRIAITASALLPMVGAAGLTVSGIAVGAPVGITMASMYIGGILGVVASKKISDDHIAKKSYELTKDEESETKRLESKETVAQKREREAKLSLIQEGADELYKNFVPSVRNVAKLEYSPTTNKKIQKILEIKKDSNISEILGSKNQKLASQTPEKISHGVNPNYSKVTSGYRDNCLKCSLTMEMRMRGYNVQAKSHAPSKLTAYSQQTCSGLMAHFTKTPDMYVYSHRTSKGAESKDIVSEKDFIRHLPDGRYMVNGPTKTGGGHSIYGIKKGEKIKYYDTQSNNGTAYSFFNADSGKTVGNEILDHSTDSFPAEFIRLDNISESDFYNISDYCEKSK